MPRWLKVSRSIAARSGRSTSRRGFRAFGTSQLVFFESFSTHVQTTSVRLRGAGTENLKLTPGGPQAGFHLIGAPAEELAKKIAAGGEVTLDVQPANDKAFSLPLTRTDFDWAHGRFASCLRTL